MLLNVTEKGEILNHKTSKITTEKKKKIIIKNKIKLF